MTADDITEWERLLSSKDVEISRLRDEIERLKTQLIWLDQHRTLATGMTGEAIVAKLVKGKMTGHTATADVITHDGVVIEVKRAALNNPNPRKNTTGRRWMWQNTLGDKNSKRFDFLILVGEAHPLHVGKYLDQTSPYVLFCVPYAELPDLMLADPNGTRAIAVAANPDKASGRAARLFSEYQRTAEWIEHRFGLPEAVIQPDAPPPPVIASPTPVVPGKLIGRPFSRRTAI